MGGVEMEGGGVGTADLGKGVPIWGKVSAKAKRRDLSSGGLENSQEVAWRPEREAGAAPGAKGAGQGTDETTR